MFVVDEWFDCVTSDTVPEKYRVAKVGLQHVSDRKIIIKKVFVEVSVTVMVVLLSFEWSVDWTDRFILKGGIGIFYIFLRSVFVLKNLGFRIGWSLLFADFPFFSIWFSVFVKNTCLMGYGFGFRWSFWIVLFGFRFLFDPSGHYAPPVISNSRETSVCSTCQHLIGLIRVLRTGMWTFIGFDCFACGFRFWATQLGNCNWNTEVTFIE